MTGNRVAAFFLAALAVLGIGLSTATTTQTQAAWTDRVYVTATATAGTWSSGNSCVAYDDTGKVVKGCAIKEIRFDEWGNPGSLSRNYYVTFTLPAGFRWVTFDVDLATATGIRIDGGKPGSMSWAKAGLQSGDFTAASGWTCAQLPRLQGRANDWAQGLYLAVTENGNPYANVCR